jgi:putative methionine-R-sulfoxide reductase with GAF domain
MGHGRADAHEGEDFHSSLVSQAASLLDGERNYVANCANMASLIYNELNDKLKGHKVNWVGFYLVDKSASLPRKVALSLRIIA